MSGRAVLRPPTENPKAYRNVESVTGFLTARYLKVMRFSPKISSRYPKMAKCLMVLLMVLNQFVDLYSMNFE